MSRQSTRTNLVLNPSFEDSSGWSAVGNPYYTDLATSPVKFGSHSGKLFVNQNWGQYGQYFKQTLTLTPGETYTFSAYCYIDAGATSFKGTRIEILDTSYVIIAREPNDQTSSGTWVRHSLTFTMPLDKTQVIIALNADGGSTTIASWYWDGVLLETGTSLQPYFDGSSTNAYWTGATNDSTSVLNMVRTAGSNRVAAQNFPYTALLGSITNSVIPATTGFSVAMRIYHLNTTGGAFIIFRQSTTNGLYLYDTSGQRMWLQAYNNSTITVNSQLATFSDLTWFHFALTFDGSTWMAYINGNLVNTLSGTMGAATGATLTIGGAKFNASQIVWQNTSTPWTASQVKTLYATGAAPQNCDFIYNLTEGSGTVATDSSGKGNNGTVSATWDQFNTWSRSRIVASGRTAA